MPARSSTRDTSRDWYCCRVGCNRDVQCWHRTMHRLSSWSAPRLRVGVERVEWSSELVLSVTRRRPHSTANLLLPAPATAGEYLFKIAYRPFSDGLLIPISILTVKSALQRTASSAYAPKWGRSDPYLLRFSTIRLPTRLTANRATCEFQERPMLSTWPTVSADLKGSQCGRFRCEPESLPVVAEQTNAAAAVRNQQSRFRVCSLPMIPSSYALLPRRPVEA